MKTICAAALAALLLAPAALGQFLEDRGTGVATSMFGTYINRGEWIVYPFFEYYQDDDLEDAPEEFGFEGEQDFRGRYRAKEGLLFMAYGLTEDLAVEFEAAFIDASFDKSPSDTSGLPAKLKESGLGDVEGQIRWRWARETARRPEMFSFMPCVRWPPCARSRPSTVSPGLALATAAVMVFPASQSTVIVAALADEKQRTARMAALLVLMRIVVLFIASPICDFRQSFCLPYDAVKRGLRSNHVPT
jgi:hypothetical protein